MLQKYWFDKSVVITGGARGQGASLALMLLEQGAHVFVMDYFDTEQRSWTALKDSAKGKPGTLHCLDLDISFESSWIKMVEILKKTQASLFGLLNNAGITGSRQTVTQTQLDEWGKVISVNLTGAFLGIKHLAPLMSQGASILNVYSIVGLTGYYSAAYTTSKWAMRGLTKSASLELASKGIRVNAIMPGVVDTEMIQNRPDLVQALDKIIPMQRKAQSDEIAKVMYFLLGPESNYITGADIPVDGGIAGGGIFLSVGREIGVL